MDLLCIIVDFIFSVKQFFERFLHYSNVFAVIFPKFVQANLYFLVYVDKCTKIFKYVPIYL